MGELQAIRKADFNWVVHPDLVWDDELPDAPGLHGAICDEIIESACSLEGARPALGRLLLGPAGAGKTHLLAMLRRRAARNGITFVMADLTDVHDFFETLLLGFVVSLQQPDASGKAQLHTLLACLINYLSSTVDGEDYARHLATQKPEEFIAPITDILSNLQRKDPVRTAQHGDVVRAAVLLHARDYEVNSIGSTWLQGMEIEDEAKHRYGFSAPRQKASDIVRGLSWLASLRGPSIIAIDQFDPIVAYNRQAARAERLKEEDESVELAKKILNDLCNGLGSLYTTTSRTVPVVTCLESSLKTLEEYGLQSNLDRFEAPQSLAPLKDAETAEAMVQGRLERAYAVEEFTPPYPSWPFAKRFFAGAIGHAPRELLKRCDTHRRACLGKGAVTELHAFAEPMTSPVPTMPTPSGDPLDRRFEELRALADIPQLVDERREDEVLAGLMVTAATCLVKESPESDAHDVVVDSEFPGKNIFMPLHARIRKIMLETGAERHYGLRALEKTHARSYQARLRAAMTGAGIDRRLDFRSLVVFRANPVPSGSVTATLTKEFHDKGGIMVAPESGEIATLWALQQLAAEGHDTFDGWLAARQPVHKLPMMQKARLAKAPNAAAMPASPAKGDMSAATAKTGTEGTTETLATPGKASPTKRSTARPPSTVVPEVSPVPVAPENPEPTEAPNAQPMPADAELPLGRRVVGGTPQGDAVRLPLLELKKHVAIFAGAGSGKTVLVKRLIEEAALLGVPSIVIDTANDLVQLGDPWPHPPKNWGPEDPARAERYFQRVETIVWTPGLERGNPMRLEPLPDLAAVAGDVDELDELDDAVAMAREALRDIVAPGKSETSRNRLGILSAALRFFAEQGGSGLEAFIALLDDLPADGDGGIGDARKHAAKMADALRSQMQIDPLLRGSGEALDPAALLGLHNPRDRTRISVINFTGLPTLDQQQQFLNRLAMALFSWIKSHPADGAVPLRGLLVVDEARDFIPGISKSPCRESFVRLTAQARKYGLGLVFATQAPKEIHNGIVSNCATSFYGKGNSPAVINAIKELLKNKGGHGDDIARLRQGRFYVHNADVTHTPIKIAASLCLSHHREPLAPEAIAALARGSRTRVAGR